MPQTIGQQLKQARLERNLSIEKVVQSTRIRGHFIESIEADDFESLPSPVQARAFLRLYANFLGLSLDALITKQLAENGGSAEPTPILIQPAPVAEPSQQVAEPEVIPTTSDLSATPPDKRPGPVIWAKNLFSHLKRPTPDQPLLEEVFQEPLQNQATAPTQAELNLVNQEAPPPRPTSQLIFSSIGKSLQLRRELLSLTLDEVERHTHVRIHYLKALEEGDLDHLPSSVQGRGMLSNYATFLDMDTDNLLLQFAEGLQSLRVERQLQSPASAPQANPRTGRRLHLPAFIERYLSVDLLVGGGLILVLLVFAFWGTSRIIGIRQAATPASGAPSISDMLKVTPAETPGTSTPSAADGNEAVVPASNETAALILPTSGPGSVHVVVEGLGSAWVRVVVDGKVVFEGRIEPGKAYPYDGNAQIEVRTGNGAAVGILYNQSSLGALGTVGEVVDRIYTSSSILNPTPTFTPSPTITLKPTITPRPSATVRPSSTPRPSPTPKK